MTQTALGQVQVWTVSSWREYWRQLAVQAWTAQSDSQRDLQSTRALKQREIEDLQAFNCAAERENVCWNQDFWESLSRLRKRVHGLGQSVQYAPAGEEMRRLVQAAQHDLQVFKEQQRQHADELAEQEFALQDSLQAALLRFEGWNQQTSTLQSTKSVTRTSACRSQSAGSVVHSRRPGASCSHANGLDSIRRRLDELMAEELADGGPMGGWQSEDHDAFMRVIRRSRRKSEHEFLVEAQQVLPHLSQEEVLQHVEWLSRSEDRQEEKRSLLERWRSARPCRSSSSSAARAAEVPAEEEHHQCSKPKDDQQQRAETKRKIAEWKHQKMQQDTAQQEEAQKKASKDHERECSRRRRAAEEKRQHVEAFRQQRKADALAQKRATEVCRRALSLEDQRRLAERNSKMTVQHATRMHTPSKTAVFDPPPRNQAFSHVESRLHHETEAHVARKIAVNRSTLSESEQGDSKYTCVPGNFAHQGVIRMTRQVPAWRLRPGT